MEWLKEILGAAYSQELERKICEEIQKKFVKKEDFSEKSRALQEKEAELDGLKASAAEARELKGQLESLEARYQKDTEELRLFREVDRALMEARVRNPELVRGALDLSKVTVGEDGKAVGLMEQLAALKKSDGYLFQEEGSEEWRQMDTGKRHGEGLRGYSREQLACMSLAEINRNWKEIAKSLDS